MDAGSAFTTVVFVGGLIALIIERIRQRFPNLDGDLVVLVSAAAGIGLAVAFDLDVAADIGLDGLVSPFNYVASGLFIAFGAGFLGTIKNSFRAKDPTSEIRAA